jgi:hypothetical protein
MPPDPDPVAKYVVADGGLVAACRYCTEPTGHDGPVCYGCAHDAYARLIAAVPAVPEPPKADAVEWTPAPRGDWLVLVAGAVLLVGAGMVLEWLFGR